MHISVARGNNGRLRVSKDDCTITIDSLIINSNSSIRTPHRLSGLGEAYICLDDFELCYVMAEYLRYNIQESVKVDLNQVNFSFSVDVKRL